MLGKKISAIYHFPKSIITRIFGQLDINARQKWNVLWPQINKYNAALNVLDAGCATGEWTLEIAKRKPNWKITGIDIKEDAIIKANKSKEILNLQNCNFEKADFITYNPSKKFDLIIAVSSSHYFNPNDTQHLFNQYHSWLNQGGDVILFVPRNIEDVPFNTSIDFQDWHDVFTKQQLEDYCKKSNLTIKSITAKLGRDAVLAKQLDRRTKNSSLLIKLLTYPKIFRLSMNKERDVEAKSLMWLLVATKINNN